jgi:DNA invertase Pin-like site-specific DNA recombinase
MRAGFSEIARRINEGRVGVLLVHDWTRLSRNPDELRELLANAKQAGTLIYCDADKRLS